MCFSLISLNVLMLSMTLTAAMTTVLFNGHGMKYKLFIKYNYIHFHRMIFKNTNNQYSFTTSYKCYVIWFIKQIRLEWLQNANPRGQNCKSTNLIPNSSTAFVILNKVFCLL